MSDKKSSDPAITACRAFIEESAPDRNHPRWRGGLAEPPKFDFDGASSYFWDIRTNKGNISVKLFVDDAPKHASSTIYLTELGFYNDLSFHRVITQFMAQGGCPMGTGTGGPGYQYDGEFDGPQKHDRKGLLSMANAGPGTDGSQFFLTFVPTPWLDGNHTIFGEVVEGLDTLDALEAAGSGSGATSEPLEMIECTIRVE